MKFLAVSLQAQALKCVLWLLCLFSGVLAISTDLMYCLEKKNYIVNYGENAGSNLADAI